METAIAIDWLRHLNDRPLIDELKRRGYRVPKKDHVRAFGAQVSRHVEDIAHGGHDPSYTESIYNSLGARLGVHLIRSGAVPVQETVLENTEPPSHHVFQAQVCVIVEDPRFEWPYPLREEEPA